MKFRIRSVGYIMMKVTSVTNELFARFKNASGVSISSHTHLSKLPNCQKSNLITQPLSQHLITNDLIPLLKRDHALQFLYLFIHVTEKMPREEKDGKKEVLRELYLKSDNNNTTFPATLDHQP